MGRPPITVTNTDNIIAPKFHFQVVPTALGTAPMTKVGPSSNADIELVQIISLVVGGFGAKGALLHNDVCMRCSQFVLGNAVMRTQLKNLTGRHIESLVVS